MAASKESRETDPFSVRALDPRAFHPRPVRRGPSGVDHRRDGRADRPCAHDRLPHGADPRVHGLPRPRPQHQPLPPRPGDARHDLRRRRPLRPGRGRPALPRVARRGDRGIGHSGRGGRRLPRVRGHHQHHAPVQAQDRARAASSATSSRCTASSSPPTSRRRRGRPSSAEPHPQHTPYTVVDRDALAAELEQVRADDVAYDFEGCYLGICAVGAPVRDQFGAVAATDLRRGAHGPLRSGGARLVRQGRQVRLRDFLRIPGLEPQRQGTAVWVRCDRYDYRRAERH